MSITAAGGWPGSATVVTVRHVRPPAGAAATATAGCSSVSSKIATDRATVGPSVVNQITEYRSPTYGLTQCGKRPSTFAILPLVSTTATSRGPHSTQSRPPTKSPSDSAYCGARS